MEISEFTNSIKKEQTETSNGWSPSKNEDYDIETFDGKTYDGENERYYTNMRN